MDAATGCHFVLLCFVQLKRGILHKVCIPVIKITTMITGGCSVHAELCYNSGFGLISRCVLPCFAFRVDLLRQLAHPSASTCRCFPLTILYLRSLYLRSSERPFLLSGCLIAQRAGHKKLTSLPIQKDSIFFFTT